MVILSLGARKPITVSPGDLGPETHDGASELHCHSFAEVSRHPLAYQLVEQLPRRPFYVV